MWRVFYFPDTGVIKYIINIESVSQLEALPYVDVNEKISVKNKMIDLNTKEIIDHNPVIMSEPILPPPPNGMVTLSAILRNKK